MILSTFRTEEDGFAFTPGVSRFGLTASSLPASLYMAAISPKSSGAYFRSFVFV